MSKTIEISEETFEKLKDQLLADGCKEVSNYEDLVGEKWYFRTVTYHTVGKVKKIVGRFAYLTEASWVADSGRFMNAIKDGTLDEVEPVGICFINLDTVVDFFPWKHKLPTDQK
jgi:hypothetical protein